VLPLLLMIMRHILVISRSRIPLRRG
jgi:hypothetical protein